MCYYFNVHFQGQRIKASCTLIPGEAADRTLLLGDCVSPTVFLDALEKKKMHFPKGT